LKQIDQFDDMRAAVKVAAIGRWSACRSLPGAQEHRKKVVTARKTVSNVMPAFENQAEANTAMERLNSKATSFINDTPPIDIDRAPDSSLLLVEAFRVYLNALWNGRQADSQSAPHAISKLPSKHPCG
jgi:hypothetical protein